MHIFLGILFVGVAASLPVIMVGHCIVCDSRFIRFFHRSPELKGTPYCCAFCKEVDAGVYDDEDGE